MFGCAAVNHAVCLVGPPQSRRRGVACFEAIHHAITFTDHQAAIRGNQYVGAESGVTGCAPRPDEGAGCRVQRHNAPVHAGSEDTISRVSGRTGIAARIAPCHRTGTVQLVQTCRCRHIDRAGVVRDRLDIGMDIRVKRRVPQDTELLEGRTIADLARASRVAEGLCPVRCLVGRRGRGCHSRCGRGRSSARWRESTGWGGGARWSARTGWGVRWRGSARGRRVLVGLGSAGEDGAGAAAICPGDNARTSNNKSSRLRSTDLATERRFREVINMTPPIEFDEDTCIKQAAIRRANVRNYKISQIGQNVKVRQTSRVAGR